MANSPHLLPDHGVHLANRHEADRPTNEATGCSYPAADNRSVQISGVVVRKGTKTPSEDIVHVCYFIFLLL